MKRALRGGRFLVTGGAGFVGSHIADQLLAAGAAEVVCLDNLVRGRRENLAAALATGRCRLVEGDLRDRDLVGRLCRDATGIFHQAALRITRCAEAPREAVEVLIVGTLNVLEGAVAAGSPKVVAASSASVYGLADRFPTAEDHAPWNNRTLYGAGKAANEGMLRAFRDTHGLPSVALRYFNVYGPRMDLHGAYTEVLSRWLDRVDRGEPPVIFGTGQQTLDLVYVEDVARANLLAFESDREDDVYNVASGTETSLRALAERIVALSGKPLGLAFAEERKVNPVPRRLASTEKAAREIGFRAATPLDEGLRRLMAWRREALAAAAGASR